MTVFISGGYTPTDGTPSNLLLEDGDALLLEDGGNLLLSEPTVKPLSHARILHAGNWLTGTASAGSTASGFYADAPNSSLTYERWKPAVDEDYWQLVMPSGGNNDVNCVGIASHNLATTGCEVRIQYLLDDDTWGTIMNVTPTTNEPIICLFDRRAATTWRIRVRNGTAPEIGVIRLGLALEMERPLYSGHAPIPLARQMTTRSNRSETGEWLGHTTQRVTLSTSYDWAHLTSDWVREYWGPFQLASEGEPFFIAWRPGTFGDVGFCVADQTPIPSNMGILDLMQVQLSVKAQGWQ